MRSAAAGIPVSSSSAIARRRASAALTGRWAWIVSSSCRPIVRRSSFLPLNGVDLTGVHDATIDVAYCSGVFMHLDEWDRFRYVTEMRRVLKPGGRIYFDNFNLRSDEGWQLFEDLFRMEPAARPYSGKN